MRKPLINTSVLKMALVGSILSLGGLVSAQSATIVERPTHIDLSATTSQSAVKVTLASYSTDDVRYRIFNGGNQYQPWDAVSETFISSTSYASGPQVPGTASTSTTFWIPFLRGNNNSDVGTYRDRLGPAYGSNHLSAALPAATALTTTFDLSGSLLDSDAGMTDEKYVLLAYDAGSTLIVAGHSDLGASPVAFTIPCPDATTIDYIEVRRTDDTLVQTVTGPWSSTSNLGNVYLGSTPGPISVDGDTTDAGYASLGTYDGAHSFGDHGLLELKAFGDATDVYFAITGEIEDNGGQHEMYLYFGHDGATGAPLGVALPAGSDGSSPFNFFNPTLDFEADFALRVSRDSAPNTYVSIIDYTSGNTDTFLTNLGAGGSYTHGAGPWTGLEVAYMDSGDLSSNTGQGFEVRVPLAAIGATARVSETFQVLALHGDGDFLSSDSIPDTGLGVNLGSDPNFNNISGRQAADFNGVTPSTDINAAYSSAGDTIHVRFDADAPSVSFDASHFSLNDSSAATVTGIANVSGNDFDLTLSVSASGDTTSDTLTFDNGVDPVETIALYSGIMSLADFRSTVDTGGDWLSTLAGNTSITVSGTVIENTLDADSARNLFIQDGTSGVQIRSDGADIVTGASVGDTVVFTGRSDAFNGQQQLTEITANGAGLLSSAAGSAPAPTVIDLGSATANTLEAAEGTLVRIENHTFVDGGNFAGNTNYDLTGVMILDIRIIDDVATIVGEAIPAGAQNIIGVLGQADFNNPRDSGYQLYPRSLADIQSVASVSDWSVLND